MPEARIQSCGNVVTGNMKRISSCQNSGFNLGFLISCPFIPKSPWLHLCSLAKGSRSLGRFRSSFHRFTRQPKLSTISHRKGAVGA
jgi:hypothetical protein